MYTLSCALSASHDDDDDPSPLPSPLPRANGGVSRTAGSLILRLLLAGTAAGINGVPWSPASNGVSSASAAMSMARLIRELTRAQQEKARRERAKKVTKRSTLLCSGGGEGCIFLSTTMQCKREQPDPRQARELPVGSDLIKPAVMMIQRQPQDSRTIIVQDSATPQITRDNLKTDDSFAAQIDDPILWSGEALMTCHE